MRPIRFDEDERAALGMLVELNGICERQQLSSIHARKFIQLGLLLETVNSYYFTQRGQIEVLRQNFRHLSGSKRAVKISGPKGTLLNARLFGMPGTAIDHKLHENWEAIPGTLEKGVSAAIAGKDALIGWCRDKLARGTQLKNIFSAQLSEKCQELW